MARLRFGGSVQRVRRPHLAVAQLNAAPDADRLLIPVGARVARAVGADERQAVGRLKTEYVMFQRDYWKMSDGDLEALANKHHIPPWGRAGKEGEHWFVDRDRIIAQLLVRDAALRTTLTTIISLVALVISIVSLTINLTK